jgi:hypothetical protein
MKVAVVVLVVTILACPIAIANTLHDDAKEASHSIGETAHNIGVGTKAAAKDVGHATKKAAQDIGHGTKKVTKTVGHAVTQATVETGHAFRDGAKEVKSALKGENSKK